VVRVLHSEDLSRGLPDRVLAGGHAQHLLVELLPVRSQRATIESVIVSILSVVVREARPVGRALLQEGVAAFLGLLGAVGQPGRLAGEELLPHQAFVG
jgi:hypothetical protein